MEWAELIKEVAGVGGTIGIAYLISYTVAVSYTHLTLPTMEEV